MIKPKPVQPAVPGGFTIDDFTVDEQAGAVTCPGWYHPAGHARAQCHLRRRPRHLPARERCTTSRSGRTVSLHPHDGLLRAARAAWASTGLREDYMKHRPNVERAIAQVATWRGRRVKLRYRGTARNHAWLKRRTAAVNLRNLAGKGLARRDGAWILAT